MSQDFVFPLPGPAIHRLALPRGASTASFWLSFKPSKKDADDEITLELRGAEATLKVQEKAIIEESTYMRINGMGHYRVAA